MTKRYKGFTITGVKNEATWDDGLESTEARPKRLLELLIVVSAHEGNKILVDHERERLADPYDYHFDTVALNEVTIASQSTTKLNRIEIDQVIPVGQRIKVAIDCGDPKTDLYGCYVYELTK